MRKQAFTLLLATALSVTGPSVAAVDTAVQETERPIVYARSTEPGDALETTELFLMDADGTNVRRLTRNHTEDNFASLSPDGTKIAFSRTKKEGADLFVMRSDGTKVRRLTTFNTEDVLPGWSPGGRWLTFTRVFNRKAVGWQSDIFTIRLRDGLVGRLTRTGRIKEFASEWAPDGTLIAFTKQDNDRSEYGIAVSSPDGTDLRWLVINPLSASGYTDVNPTWSPDSQWVAFSRDIGDDPFVDIFKVHRDGGEAVAVTERFELSENPSWGPGGIIFRNEAGIAIVQPDGSDFHHLTPIRTSRPYHWPDW